MRWSNTLRCGVTALALATACAVAASSADAPRVHVGRSDTGDFELWFKVAMDVSVPLGADAVRTTPARALDCGWDDDGDVLICRLPLGHLPRASRIRVHLGPGLRTAAGRRFAPAELTFDTDPPRIDLEVIGWAAGTPTLALDADIPLRAGTLDDKVVLRAGDLQWPVTLQARGLTPEGGTRYALAWPGDVPADTPLQVHIVGPFFAASGELPGNARRPLATFRTAVPPRLASVDCVESGSDAASRSAQVPPAGATDAVALSCRETQVLRLRWTARLDDASRARLLDALPQGARASFRDAGFALGAGELPVPGTELTVAGLRAGDALRWRSGEALAAVDGRAVPMADIEVVTARAKPGLVWQGLAMPPDAQARVLPRVNDAPAFDMGWIGFDGALRGGRFMVTESRDTVRTVTSPEVDAVLARGGWVEWNAPLDAPMRSVSWAPPFDVRLAAMRGAIAVWAVPWRGDGAIADAEVELHRISEADGVAIVARGRTNTQGVVVLALPDGVEGGERVRWGVQVHHRDGTASQLLDLDAPLGARPNDDVGAWLVTDRLVYRPGDTVQFAGWRRVRIDGDGHVPAAGSSTFEFKQFHAPEEVLEVPVRWDAAGRTSGHLRLPRDLAPGDYCFAGLTWHAGCVRVQQDLASALWADVRRDPGVESLTFGMEVGTWSGEPPRGSLYRGGRAYIDAWSPAQMYPRWSGYTFLPLARPDIAEYPVEFITGADGRVRGRARADLDGASPLPLSGNVLLEAGASRDSADHARSDPPRAPWAPSAGTRYVGLRLAPHTGRDDATVHAEGVVIDANGAAVPAAAIAVEVRDADAVDGPVLARCSLVSSVPGACAWPNASHRRYRVTARSGDAIASEQIVEANAGARPAESAPPDATWSWRALPDQPGAPAAIVVHHAFAEADVLALAAGADGAIVAHAARVRAGGELELPYVGPDATQRPMVWRLLVRERLPVDAGPRPARIQGMVVEVPRPAAPMPSPLQVSFIEGGRALMVRNAGGAPVDAVLSVFDEASPVLAPWLWNDRDPARAPERAAFDTYRYGVVAPLFSMPYGHAITTDRAGQGPLAGCVSGALAPAPTVSIGIAAPVAACADGDTRAAAFWRETNRAERDESNVYGGPHPREPVTASYTAPVARDHAWPAGAPRGGDAWARHHAVLWEPGVTLAPGETRTFALPAAAHPVHWVARAWTVVAPGVVTASDAHVAVAPAPQE